MKDTILLDMGAADTKFGISTEESPSFVFSSALGTPKINKGKETDRLLFGSDLDSYQGLLSREDLFPGSQPRDQDVILKFLDHCFQESKLDTTGKKLVFATSSEWSADFNSTLLNYFYQDRGFESILVQRGEFFDLLSHRITTGAIMNVGHYFTRIMLYHNGKPVIKKGAKSNLGGRAIRQYLRHLFKAKYPYLSSSRYNVFLTQIIQEKCDLKVNLKDFLASDVDPSEFTEELEIPQFKDLLPLGIERFIAPEILFYPELLSLKEKSVSSLLIDSLKDCHPTLRPQIFKNVILSGGGATYAYFPSRILADCANVPLIAAAKILRHPQPAFGVWKGMQTALKSNLYEKHAKTATQYYARL